MNKMNSISKKIWSAMQHSESDILKKYIHPDAVFIHMGATLSRDEEIDVIMNQRIIYDTVEFQETKEISFDATYLILNQIVLTAIVNGTPVTNTFVVTEVYSQNQQLLSMSYTRINTQP